MPTEKPYSHLILYADGGSRGNPGPSAGGAVLIDPQSQNVILTVGKFLQFGDIGVDEKHNATNNVAEYYGLIAGLQEAAKLGVEYLEIRMDSKLVVNQVNGDWNAKHADMIPLLAQARKELKHFPKTKISWHPRAENSLADAAVNKVLGKENDESLENRQSRKSFVSGIDGLELTMGNASTLDIPHDIWDKTFGEQEKKVDACCTGCKDPENKNANIVCGFPTEEPMHAQRKYSHAPGDPGQTTERILNSNNQSCRTMQLLQVLAVNGASEEEPGFSMISDQRNQELYIIPLPHSSNMVGYIMMTSAPRSKGISQAYIGCGEEQPMRLREDIAIKTILANKHLLRDEVGLSYIEEQHRDLGRSL